jgi:hypothetical protein
MDIHDKASSQSSEICEDPYIFYCVLYTNIHATYLRVFESKEQFLTIKYRS